MEASKENPQKVLQKILQKFFKQMKEMDPKFMIPLWKDDGNKKVLSNQRPVECAVSGQQRHRRTRRLSRAKKPGKKNAASDAAFEIVSGAFLLGHGLLEHPFHGFLVCVAACLCFAGS